MRRYRVMDAFVAALPMYDWPEVRASVDAEWAALRDRLRAAGIAAPKALTRPGEGGAPDDLAALWRDPRLLLAQSCWGPMQDGLARHVLVVGQPDYSDIEGGAGEDYSSAILMRREPGQDAPVAAPADGAAILPLDRLRGRRFAYNGADSMSGLKAIARDLAAAGTSLDIFAGSAASGGHRCSIRLVAAGAADVCAVDCRSWALAGRWEPAAAALAPVGWTARSKGLPFIMAKALAPLEGAVRAALADAGAIVR